MLAGVRWLNQYLNPATLTADEAEAALMGAGFPIESRTTLPDGDVRLDVEVTSNRGDCLCHLGMAREIAAKTGRALVEPAVTLPPGKDPIANFATLENREPDACPRFTLRVIRGVKIGPSPAWLVSALEAVGQRSINNVVDVTNYINFELGHPCHVFDLDKLAGRTLVVRFAAKGETLLTLDGKKRTLAPDELVVADAERPQSLAGVIGGGDSEVTNATVNIAFEMATWDPVTIRRAARRHQIRTDASYRFERGVDAHSLEHASRRAVELLIKVAGGSLCEGVLVAGKANLGPPAVIQFRPSRCRDVLGFNIADAEMHKLLASIGISVKEASSSWACTPPTFRLDLKREVDLIEEVGRLKGLEAVQESAKLAVAVRPPQNRERAMRELATTLTGLGFYETVTFSFVTPAAGDGSIAPGLSRVDVDDERRGGEPTLRPSILPSLLACRRVNQDGQVALANGVRLFETAAVFAQQRDGTGFKTIEKRRLALVMDVPGAADSVKRTLDEKRAGVRAMRGTIESLVHALGGAGAAVLVTPKSPDIGPFDPAAHASISINAPGAAANAVTPIGSFGLVSGSAMNAHGLDVPVVAAEIDLDPIIALFPGKASVTVLPEFPATDRDVSFIVSETVAWSKLAALIDAAKVEQMEHYDFVTAYRGKQIGAGKKSITVRMRFRDAGKTLRREEVEPQVQRLIEVMKREVQAEVRTA